MQLKWHPHKQNNITIHNKEPIEWKSCEKKKDGRDQNEGEKAKYIVATTSH